MDLSRYAKTAYLLCAVILCASVLLISSRFREYSFEEALDITTKAASIRGLSDDLWADVVVGKRDFTEIAPREVVPYKLSAPGGVIVDRSIPPGRLYVWDSGNSRILGVDLATCLSGSQACSANLIIGQTQASDYAACNQDASFASYPTRSLASASTLCGIPESSHTTLEDKSFVGMATDAEGNLYVPDSRNHRVLKYNSPFTTDTIADEVWGQVDFAGNGCNLTGGIGGGFGGAAPQPTDTSLCFHSTTTAGAGVALDAQGNLWVADGGNNRVLRFSQTETGISKTADLVLGQPSFTTGGDWSYGATLNKLNAPSAVRVHGDGTVYVADTGNNRIIKYTPPFTHGMDGSVFLATGISNPIGIELDADGQGLWVMDNDVWDARIRLFGFDGSLIRELPRLPNRGGGSLGIDTLGTLYASTYVYGQDVHSFTKQLDGSYLRGRDLFSPPAGYNLTTDRRLEHAAWVGVGVTENQLIVSDGRLLFWNDPSALTNGKAPDGFLGAASATVIPNPGFGQIKVDKQQRVWATKANEVHAYQAPLTTNVAPIKTLTSPLAVLGGGQILFSSADPIAGLAVTGNSEFLWLSQPTQHRVMRLRDPLSATPRVDVILGQTSVTGNQCNQGIVPQPNTGTTQTATLDMLCYPGSLSLDNFNNLYVSDHYIEAVGNWRQLMFSSSLFPPDNTQVIFAPMATKEFPRKVGNNQYSHATFEAAFDSKNRMVVGYNPYLGPRFPEFYTNPTQVNASNPSDPLMAKPDGHVNDFFGWAVAATFDAQDNLYLYDANRGQVRIYRQPFGPPLPQPTPTPIATPTPTASPTPVSQTVDLLPVADAYVRSDSATRNYGTAQTLIVDGSPVRIAYLKFDLSAYTGKTITSVKLRIRISGASAHNQTVKIVNDTSWAERGITYANRPALSTTLATIVKPSSSQWREIDITSHAAGKAGQLFSLGIDSTGGDDMTFRSKEYTNAVYRPVLRITYQ